MKLKPSLHSVFFTAVVLLLFSGCATTGEQGAADVD